MQRQDIASKPSAPQEDPEDWLLRHRNDLWGQGTLPDGSGRAAADWRLMELVTSRGIARGIWRYFFQSLIVWIVLVCLFAFLIRNAR